MISREQLSRAKYYRYPVRFIAVVAVGTAVALAMGLLVVGADPTVGLFFVPALAVFWLALRNPYWMIVLTIAQFAFIPGQGNLLGHYVPPVFQILAPIAFGAVLLKALARRAGALLRLKLADIFVAAFGLWGLVGMFVVPGMVRWKWYGNRVMLPMLIYFTVRLLPLRRNQVQLLIWVLVVVTVLQSGLMLHESISGASPLYGTPAAEEVIEGVTVAMGPFGYIWNASTYLALFPSLIVYLMSRSRKWWIRILLGVALITILGANGRTMERAGLGASLLAIGFCLLAPRLRRTALAVIGILAIAYLPWSLGNAGGLLMDRFEGTDQSRYAYRVAAFNIIKSQDWNPVFGIGWARFGELSGQFGTEEKVIAWGDTEATVAQVAFRSKLHNVWLAVPLELGMGGSVLFLGVLAGLGAGILRILGMRRRGYTLDGGLLCGIVGSLVALGAIGYYHNIYFMAASMTIFWTFYALLTDNTQVFVQSPQDSTDG